MKIETATMEFAMTTFTFTGFVINPFWGTNGYGFVRLDGSTVSAFMRVETILEAGFLPVDLKENVYVSVECRTASDGRMRVVRLLEVNRRLAPNFFREEVVDRDRDQGVVIVKITERGHERRTLEYRVYGVTSTDRFLWGTYPSLAQAREAIGRVISPPKPVGHGVKTNIPPAIAIKSKGAKNKAA